MRLAGWLYCISHAQLLVPRVTVIAELRNCNGSQVFKVHQILTCNVKGQSRGTCLPLLWTTTKAPFRFLPPDLLCLLESEVLHKKSDLGMAVWAPRQVKTGVVCEIQTVVTLCGLLMCYLCATCSENNDEVQPYEKVAEERDGAVVKRALASSRLAQV